MIDPSPTALTQLVDDQVDAGFYVDAGTAEAALLDRSKFNAIGPTAEDLVVAKLEWAAASDSDRQRRDVLGILRVTVDLDEAYIERWATAPGLGELWRAIRDEARSL